ncbi:MAG: folylpolyglutamate synthase/dihydrofolate synthase family protein [Chloroflexota bacterium]
MTYLYSFINRRKKQVERYQANKEASRARVLRLLQAVGEPHTSFPSIHIAGTKGKGSVAAMCANALRLSGLRVGLFTSPHLQDFRERIRIVTMDEPKGWIPEDDFVVYVDQLRPLLEAEPQIGWFEAVTLIAFLYFAREQVDVAVIEVGLGGRLDATNVITPLVSVITSLSLDHTQFLGETLTEIAGHKGGIIKRGVPVVVAEQQLEAMACLERIAAEQESRMIRVGEEWRYEVGEELTNGRYTLNLTHSPAPDFLPAPHAFPLALAGLHQLENGTVALATLTAVRSHFPALTLESVEQGLTTVNWNGRLQIVHQDEDAPTFLVDCAHNLDSATKLTHALTRNFLYNKLWLIFGAPADKDIAGMVRLLFPLADAIIATTVNHPRSLSPDDIVQLAQAENRAATTTTTVTEALQQAWQLAQPGDLICATGSILVVGDLLNAWEQIKLELLK